MSDTASVDTEALEAAVKTLPDEPAPEKDEADKAKGDEEAKAADDAAGADGADAEDEDTDGEDDAAAGDDDEAEADSDDEEEQPKPRRKSAQKRIAELTRQRHEAERRERDARAEADRLRQAMEKPADQPEDKGPPKSSDFETYDAYVDALTDYKAERIFQKNLAKLGETAEQNAEQQRQRALATRYQEQAAKARIKYDDFDDVTSSETLRVTPVMAQAIAEHEHGAEVAYHLGNNPAEAAEIAGLSDVQQITRIERIATRLTAKPSPKRTAAPDPAKPVKASRAATRKRTVNDARSYDEYEAARLRQLKKG